jgi:antitoxin component YwqK of YwqJK toxin-antitoxin module
MKNILRINWNECEDVGIVTHYKKEPFTGICYDLYDNGNLKDEQELVNGLKQGKGKWYHENGQLEEEGEYKDDKQYGIWVYYNDTGQEIGRIDCTDMDEKEILRKEIEMSSRDFYEKNPERSTKDLEFFREYERLNTEKIKEEETETEEEVEEEISYKNDTKDGPWKSYYENGQLKEEGNYKDGKNYHGQYKEYHENGQLKHDGKYKDGIQEGICKLYYENGQMELETNFKDGEHNGQYKEYHENGQLKYERNYKDGEDYGQYKEYHENGQLKYEGDFKDGLQDGVWKLYHENGQLKKENSFKNKEKISQKSWDEDGNIIDINKSVFSNEEFKKSMSNYSYDDINNPNIGITLKKGCGYEKIEFFGEYKGHKYTIIGGDSGKWFETDYEEDINTFIEEVGENEISVLENYLSFSWFPEDSYGFFGESIIWDKETTSNIKDEIKNEDPEYDNLISESVNNGDYSSEGSEFNKDNNNISEINISFNYKGSNISIEWKNEN